MRRFLPILVLIASFAQVDCVGVAGIAGNSGAPPPPPLSMSVTVSPNPATVRAGAPQSFSATARSSSNSNVTWQVNRVTGGSVTRERRVVPERVALDRRNAGTSVVVSPSQTTDFALYATNAFIRTTATVTVQ